MQTHRVAREHYSAERSTASVSVVALSYLGQRLRIYKSQQFTSRHAGACGVLYVYNNERATEQTN